MTEIHKIKSIIDSSPNSQNDFIESFVDFLLEEFNNPELSDLKSDNLNDFIFCCLYFEYFSLSMNDEYSIVNQILFDVLKNNNITTILSRFKGLQLSKRVRNIESEWKSCLNNLLDSYTEIKNTRCPYLTEQGNDVFLDRIGVKTVSDIQIMLNEINSSNLLARTLVELIQEKTLTSDLPRILGWITKSNTLNFNRDLINVS